MNKKLLLFFFLFLFICVFLFYSLTSTQKNSLPPNISLPTPTPVGQPGIHTTLPIRLIESSPVDGATGVDSNQNIILTFNQPVASESVQFFIFPETPVTITSQNNSLTILPTQPYENNITYTYSLFAKNGAQIVAATFSTGNSPILPLTGRYPNLDTVANSAQRQNYPDVFLAGYTPYQNNLFSITSDFPLLGDHYVFTVSPNTPTAKQGLISWLKLLGLTQDQINTLEIHYK